MKILLKSNDITALELDVMREHTEVQLLRYNEPNPGLLLQRAQR